MSRGLRPHLDEATLLRLVVADLDDAEESAAGRHLQGCAACRREKSRTVELDTAMRDLSAKAARPVEASGILAAGDPFFRRPGAARRSAREAGLDVVSLAEAAAEASLAAGPRTSALLGSAKGGRAAATEALASLRFESLVDRLALSGALAGAFDRVEDDPAAYRHFAEAAFDRISKEPPVEGLSEKRPKPEEYAAPLAALAAEAQLLAAACGLLHAEFDAAREGLEAAWKSLGGGRDSLPLVARLETIASILRTIAGKPAEGLALAERAAETFAVTGHPVDAAKALLAKGFAEMAAGRAREGNTALRRARGAFARSGSWGAFAVTVTALAVAETGPSDGPKFKGLFQASLGRLRRAGALDAFQFLRATHRIVLLTRREPKREKERGAAKRAAETPRFEASLPYLMRGGDRLAEGVVGVAREGDETLRVRMQALHPHPARAFALLFACQKGTALVGENPHRALTLARLVFDEAESLLDANIETKAATPARRQTVQAEARLFEAQGQIQLGYAQKSRDAAIEARELFESAGDTGFGQALSDYFEGQAAGFAKDYSGAERLLKKALKIFSEFGQDHLIGRAGAALGTVYQQRGDDQRALPYLEQALTALDPELDSRQYLATLANRALSLSRLDRFDEARANFARALNIARKLSAPIYVHQIRDGLAEMDFRRGRFDRALSAFSDLWREAVRAGYDHEAVFAHLYVAECLGRLGREAEMAESVCTLREAQKPSPFAPSSAVDELFSCLDQGMLDADLVRNVREYLEREQGGGRGRPSRLMSFVS